MVYEKKDGVLTKNIITRKQIALFESEMSRITEKMDDSTPFISEILFLKCGNMKIVRQIIENGLMIGADRYIFYSSSTGQMKDKSITLLKEEFFRKNQYRIQCGLSDETINQCGGINMGKHLTYNSLSMSNSVEMKTDLSIDDVIVVKDFETNVFSKVNYLDVDTLQVIEKEMSINIPHMDGAGIFCHGTFPCSCQIRGGSWIKGCVFEFDFHRFIRERCIGDEIIRDAWDTEIPIRELLKIKLILTESQFKMRKYYNSWENYKDAFKKAGLSFCINNTVHNPVENSKIHLAYQVLQTIPRKNMTDIAIERLSDKSVSYINGAKDDADIALSFMGIDSCENEELDCLKASIKQYPDMLNSIYVKKKLQYALESERKKALSGKVIVDGIWSYICPDIYAFCEWLFLNEKTPNGLVPSGMIYNAYYNEKEIEEVCCLRYPHLSDCEQGIRQLIKSDMCMNWFCGYDTIISTHDLLTKTLQADVDGDKMAVISDRAYIDLIDRDKLPLYYHMRKGEPEEITSKAVYECLERSFNNESIGDVSNVITKILNGQDEPDINLVRILTAYNNYCIDFPKTQIKLGLGKYLEQYIAMKLELPPYFFIYAKDKKASNCHRWIEDGQESRSNIDRISKYIEIATRKNITKTQWLSGNNKFNASYLMGNPLVNRKDEKYLKLEHLLNQLKRKERNGKCGKDFSEKVNTRMKSLNGIDGKEQYLRYELFYFLCSRTISEIGIERNVIVDFLVDIEYYQEAYVMDSKDILWNCYGDMLYHNICRNMKKNPADIPVKRSAYQSLSDKNKIIERYAAEEYLKMTKDKTVVITKEEYEWIFSLNCRADCQDDKYLLFILYVLYKRHISYENAENVIKQSEFRIYNNLKRKPGITRELINKWIGKNIADKGITRLEKTGIISVSGQKTAKAFVINFNLPEEPIMREDGTSFVKVGGGNPLLYLYQITGERKILSCEICSKLFVAVGNNKTCSSSCSRKLELKHKQKA